LSNVVAQICGDIPKSAKERLNFKPSYTQKADEDTLAR
jgi:hypothetical protein